MADVGDSYGW